MSLKDTIKDFDIYLGGEESFLDKHYRQITEEIKVLWGQPEFYDYLKKLTLIEQDYDSNQLPYDAMTEIFILENIHDRLYPTINPRLKCFSLVNHRVSLRLPVD